MKRTSLLKGMYNANLNFKRAMEKAEEAKDWISYGSNLKLRRRNIEAWAIIRLLEQVYRKIKNK